MCWLWTYSILPCCAQHYMVINSKKDLWRISFEIMNCLDCLICLPSCIKIRIISFKACICSVYFEFCCVGCIRNCIMVHVALCVNERRVFAILLGCPDSVACVTEEAVPVSLLKTNQGQDHSASKRHVRHRQSPWETDWSHALFGQGTSRSLGLRRRRGGKSPLPLS